ncbi:arginyl-tRNA--protein transferase 1 isoform X1 [Vanessa cardui]|uniref:arginyl-tRNA--protein transferase 1 isoform X1 n=1 Tax=Vanessa cardui TaxID=171605 RepID=UPI001F128CE4|nr:arginyl-tRNA--protein transferase 1 isoform X1 [Vanessa cardui]
MMKRSIIEYFSEHDGYKCGYCKKPNSNYNYGMWAHTMTVTDYQDLIDRGWRRSGKYCYKPTLDIICCPMYTIRCRALEFKSSKSQKKILKRFNKFLMGQDEDKSMSRSNEDMTIDDAEGREQFVETTRVHQEGIITDTDLPFIEDASDPRNEELETIPTEEPHTSKVVKQEDESTSQTDIIKDKCTKLNQNKVAGPDPTKGPCKKAKLIRRQRMLEKLKNKGVDINSLDTTNKNKEKQIEDFINELPNEVTRKFEIKLVRTSPPSAEWLATSKETHEVYVKYQTIIHGDKPEKCTESKFKDFLVNSPLLEEYSEVGPYCGYGSFHQQYWLDGKIIAVGVLDILPKCVSSVYFFYDPAYRNLTLGTYGALREISFTRYLHTMSPSLQYYYMGFYIHSCRKMRYKGNFCPSDLLCPETYKWFPIKGCLEKLEIVPYTRFDPDIDSVDENYPSENDINYIQVLSRGEVMHYKLYRRRVGKRNENIEEMQQYAKLVGSKTARSLVVVR